MHKQWEKIKGIASKFIFALITLALLQMSAAGSSHSHELISDCANVTVAHSHSNHFDPSHDVTENADEGAADDVAGEQQPDHAEGTERLAHGGVLCCAGLCLGHPGFEGCEVRHPGVQGASLIV
ncbi:MAG: hypothetical protein E5X17_03290, partial [Mesorhizobium sp.]